MAIDSFIFEQLFILLVPKLAVWFEGVGTVGVVRFPSEPDFVQKCLPIKSNFVIPMKGPLRANPNP
jgi:hypothetical protein